MIEKHAAGFRLDKNDQRGLASWLEDMGGWRKSAVGSQALAREHFDIERNVDALQTLWAGISDRSQV